MNISFTWEKNSSTSFLSSGFVQKFSSYRPESARLREACTIEGGAGHEEALRPICALLRPEQIGIAGRGDPCAGHGKGVRISVVGVVAVGNRDRRRARAGRGRRKGRCEGGGILRRDGGAGCLRHAEIAIRLNAAHPKQSQAGIFNGKRNCRAARSKRHAAKIVGPRAVRQRGRALFDIDMRRHHPEPAVQRIIPARHCAGVRLPNRAGQRIGAAGALAAAAIHGLPAQVISCAAQARQQQPQQRQADQYT